jgi:hypothetical protein
MVTEMIVTSVIKKSLTSANNTKTTAPQIILIVGPRLVGREQPYVETYVSEG